MLAGVDASAPEWPAGPDDGVATPAAGADDTDGGGADRPAVHPASSSTGTTSSTSGTGDHRRGRTRPLDTLVPSHDAVPR
jgi:hypothetical protein